ncbi:MAG TPA: nitroreductase family protein [Polyangiaceae bacterium]
MTLIHVDPTTCCGDAVCAEVCPLGLISLENEAGLPAMGEGSEEFCVHCGHCVAVCGTGAMSHCACPVSECEPLNADWRFHPSQVASFFKGRRSVRRYKEQLVPKETIERIIDISRYAPTGQNAQSVSWLVVYNPERVRTLAAAIVTWLRSMNEQQPTMAHALHVPWYIDCWDHGTDTVLRGAPHIVIAHGTKGDEISKLGSLLNMASFELAAQAHGLGACWSGYTMMLPGVEELLGLPDGHQAFAAMLLGFPKHQYHRIPVRRAANVDWML